MFLPHFEYLSPTNTEELVALLARYGERAKLLAGGTDLLVAMKDRLLKPEYVIDIGNLADLQNITYEEGKGLTIGAGVKIAALERSPVIRERYYALYQAARELGSPQVRAMATIGGNSCNASPAAETPPPLIALRARVSLVSRRGRREIPLEEFILGNRRTALETDEFLESFYLPEPWPHSASRYLCLGLREAMEIDAVNVAVNVALNPGTGAVEQVRIVMGAVGPTPLRAREAEGLLLGKVPGDELLAEVAEACAAAARPIDDIRASAAYRRQAVKVLVRRAFAEALAAAGGRPKKLPGPGVGV